MNLFPESEGPEQKGDETSAMAMPLNSPAVPVKRAASSRTHRSAGPFAALARPCCASSRGLRSLEHLELFPLFPLPSPPPCPRPGPWRPNPTHQQSSRLACAEEIYRIVTHTFFIQFFIQPSKCERPRAPELTLGGHGTAWRYPWEAVTYPMLTMCQADAEGVVGRW